MPKDINMFKKLKKKEYKNNAKIKGDKMNYYDFKNVIENESSDIYLMILLFLYEKKPFKKNSLTSYSKKVNKDSLPLSPNVKSPKKLVASPTKNYSFSPYQVITRQRRRTVTLKQSEYLKMREMLDSEVDIKRRGSRVGTVGNNDIIKLVPTLKENNIKFFGFLNTSLHTCFHP